MRRKMALGMGAHVAIIDRNLNRLRELDDIFNGHGRDAGFQPVHDCGNAAAADLVIGSVLIPGASAPKLVRRDMICRDAAGLGGGGRGDRPGRVLRNVAGHDAHRPDLLRR